MARRRKIRFKRITFKITSNQKEIIQSYCKSKRTTPVKLFKKAVKFYMEKNQAMPKQDYHISKNQLKLFDLD